MKLQPSPRCTASPEKFKRSSIKKPVKLIENRLNFLGEAVHEKTNFGTHLFFQAVN